MIEYIPYHKIDKVKYDRCIELSKERRIYAFSWYLDCVTVSWDVLVEDDYRSVMPLPKNVKYGIPYIFTPSWVQQLGVFSKQPVSADKVIQFIRSIPGKFLWIDYQLNSENNYQGSGSVNKKNYLLSLRSGYEEIEKGFNKNRKRILNKKFSSLKLDKKGANDVFMENYRALNKPYPLPDQAVEKLKCLCSGTKDQVQVWNVFSEGRFVGGLIWLQDTSRITYLVPMATELGKQLHVPTYLVDALIREFQGQDLVLDFEGSMVEGVEKFYQSFGADVETYCYFKKRIISHV